MPLSGLDVHLNCCQTLILEPMSVVQHGGILTLKMGVSKKETYVPF